MRRGIDTVFFDLDGTLLRDDHMDAVVSEVCGLIASRHPGLEASAVAHENQAAWATVWSLVGDDWMRGLRDELSVPREVWQRTLDALGIDDGEGVEAALAVHEVRERRAFRLFDESLGVMQALRERDVRIGLITNGPSQLQRGKLATVGIDDAFDVVIVSGEVGDLKPEPGIFDRALAAVGGVAERSAHVGDSLSADIAGARGAGMLAVWINRGGRTLTSEDPVPDAELTSLDRLPDLIGR